MPDLEFYGWRQCSTCRDARAWLLDHGAVLVAERDIFADPLDEATIRTLAGGHLQRLLSTRSPGFRARGIDPETLTEAQVLSLLQEDPRMIRRPLVRRGDQTVVGFDKPALERLWNAD